MEPNGGERKISWVAIISLLAAIAGAAVCMLLPLRSAASLVAFLCLTGIVLGAFAIGDIKLNHTGARGAGHAAVAIAISVLTVAVFVLQPLQPHRPVGAACLRNLKHQAAAFALYAEDHNDRLPSAENWGGSIGPYVFGDPREVLTCPALPKGEVGGYAFNSALSCRKWPEKPSNRLASTSKALLA